MVITYVMTTALLEGSAISPLETNSRQSDNLSVENNLRSVGVTRPYLYNKLKEQLDAVRTNMEPDYMVRDKAVDKCLKLLGDLREVPVVNVDARKQVISVTVEQIKDLNDILSRMNQIETSWGLATPGIVCSGVGLNSIAQDGDRSTSSKGRGSHPDSLSYTDVQNDVGGTDHVTGEVLEPSV